MLLDRYNTYRRGNMTESSKFNPTGNLEIWKIYKSGEKELHWSDHNIIVSGMGVGLSHMFSASGGTSIVDYQILNFQVGVSGDLDNYGVETYQLSSSLPSGLDYGTVASVEGEDPTISFSEIEEFSPIENGAIGPERTFVRIKYSNIHKVNKSAVRYTLVLNEKNANYSKELNEVGLFMRNPRGLTPPAPILVAYRPFTSIKKTDAFTLVFLWTLQF